jgi:uncharacterized protein YndB with AHSA1/START domain
MSFSRAFDPELDLMIERVTDVLPRAIWRVWTDPALVTQWFAPAPWTAPRAEIELHPGGLYSVTMRSPEGEEFSGPGCVLEVVENTRFVWTSAMGPGFRPLPVTDESLPFTAEFSLESTPEGTLYRAVVRHPDAETCARHAAMGFAEGWGQVTDQAIALARTL